MQCSKCSKEKELTEFYSRPDRKNKTYTYCKECFNSYCVTRWIELKKKAILYKGGKCTKCGYDRYYGALEFHHLDSSQKDADWGKLKKRNWNKITEELDKCVLLCSNCHRETHDELLKI